MYTTLIHGHQTQQHQHWKILATRIIAICGNLSLYLLAKIRKPKKDKVLQQKLNAMPASSHFPLPVLLFPSPEVVCLPLLEPGPLDSLRGEGCGIALLLYKKNYRFSF